LLVKGYFALKSRGWRCDWEREVKPREKIQSAPQEEVFRITSASTATGLFPLTINGFTSIA
jgi:hypothetical protein